MERFFRQGGRIRTFSVEYPELFRLVAVSFGDDFPKEKLDIDWEEWGEKQREEHGQTQEDIDEMMDDTFGSKEESTSFSPPD